ncbi:5986_t:CDS:2, partial [Paraglomus occultum]
TAQEAASKHLTMDGMAICSVGYDTFWKLAGKSQGLKTYAQGRSWKPAPNIYTQDEGKRSWSNSQSLLVETSWNASL